MTTENDPQELLDMLEATLIDWLSDEPTVARRWTALKSGSFEKTYRPFLRSSEVAVIRLTVETRVDVGGED